MTGNENNSDFFVFFVSGLGHCLLQMLIKLQKLIPFPSPGERVGRHLLIGFEVAVSDGFSGNRGTMENHKEDKAV
jgi:hypothetical protein